MPKKQENGIRLLEPMRDSLRALLGVPCFVRRSREEDALFVTDALRRTDHPDALRARLADSGEWRSGSGSMDAADGRFSIPDTAEAGGLSG